MRFPEDSRRTFAQSRVFDNAASNHVAVGALASKIAIRVSP
jgi:hypothetical protein